MIDLLKDSSNKTGLAAIGIAPAIDEVIGQFPWAKSVVCAAISYLAPEVEADCGPISTGLVARFARSVDYHRVLRAKLQLVTDAVLRMHPDARTTVCVDTCPLPERKLAVLSGIARPGKNGNVFVDGYGSWVVLGEIVTDLPLRCDAQPQKSICGKCTICIDSCPANAIKQEGIIDRTRCISALTQSSGAIDEQHREMIGNRIYGCDTCQQVCPHNKGIQPTSPEFAVNTFPGKSPELIGLINLTRSDFNNIVAKSSIGWMRRTRIRRNAAIAAGNINCEAACPALIEMLADENAVLREAAQWAINKIRCGS
ncbi:MAG: tRNA epoxyqueuosine(34) reductase QueG [Armatimonadetes bacterium]|jgi:epoxyqueuosine reductase|nr:tRNA epoxyqueuosine(34) reductase QueG [Armatimonadota bacterium]